MRQAKDLKRAYFIYPPGLFSRVFPLGFSQIISVAKECGFEVKLLDLNFHKYTETLIEEAISSISNYKPDMICLTGYSNHIKFIIELTTRIKNKYPQILVVGGGYWCRWSSEFALNYTGCDVVIAGEGDAPFRELCLNFSDNNIDKIEHIVGVAMKRASAIIANGVAELGGANNIDFLPRPEYELFNFKDNYVWQEGEGDVCCSMQTGRGCVGKCMFCTGAKQEYRKYSHERILDEIRYVKERYGVNRIYFKESLTVVNNKWSKELLRKIINADLRIKFQAICRVDGINEEIVDLLKNAGCFSVQFGFETADNNMLRKIMHKEISSKQIINAVNLCRKVGIFPSGTFLIGLPGETLKSLFTTMFFLLVNRIPATGVMFPVPFPGTELYQIAKRDFGLSDEKILLNKRMCGYEVFYSGFRKQREYLEEFKLCNLPTYALIIFHIILRNLLGVNVLIYNEGYAVASKIILSKIYYKLISLMPFSRFRIKSEGAIFKSARPINSNSD